MNNITEWESVPIIFDIPYASRLLGLMPETIRKRCKKCSLPAFKLGGEWRFEKTHFSIMYVKVWCLNRY